MTSVPHFEPLGDANFHNWQHRVYCGLVAKNLQSAIKPIDPVAPADGVAPPAVDPAAAAAAALVDEQAKAYLLSNMDDTRMQQALQYETAREMWDGLTGAYQRSLPARRNALNRELHDTVLGNMTMHQYIDTIKAIANKLAAMGNPVSEAEKQRLILYGLRFNRDYDLAVGIIEALNAEPDINAIQTRLADAEQKLKERKTGVRDATRDNRAYFAGNNRNNGRNNGTNERKPAGPNTRCYECNQFGHYAADCPKRKDGGRRNDGNQRNNNRGNNKGTSGAPKMLAFPVFTARQPPALAGSPVLDCIMDTGAQIHIVNDREFLTDYQELPEVGHPQSVLGISGNSSVDILGVGTAYVETQQQLDGLQVTGDITLKLMNVYYSPKSTANLISVARLTEAGAGYHQGPKHACIATWGPSQEEWITEVTTSRRTEGFFSLPLRRMQETALVTSAACPAAAACPATVSSDAAAGLIAHQKAGHASYGRLIRAANSGMSPGLGATASQLKAASLTPCIPCLTGKATRKPAPPSSARSNEKLGRVHADLAGPMPKMAIGGELYALEVKDEHTRYSVVSILESKAEVPSKLIAILTQLSTQAGCPVKVLRSDHGSEFDNSTISAYCDKVGIKREFSPPYDPRLNGRVERQIRSNGEAMRTVLIETQLPKELWGEILISVNDVRNKLPVTGLDITPHEAFYGSPPNLANLHPLGCKAVARNPKPHLNKLLPKGEECWLVGYEPGGGFRVYLEGKANGPSTSSKPRVQVRRDVDFIENELYGSTRPPPLPPAVEEAFLEPGTECSICQSTSCFVPSEMLLCDAVGCDKGAHLLCLTPPLASVPKGLWFCPACRDQEATLPRKREEVQPLILELPSTAPPQPPAQPPPAQPPPAQPPPAPQPPLEENPPQTPASGNQVQERNAPGAPQPPLRRSRRRPADAPDEPQPVPAQLPRGGPVLRPRRPAEQALGPFPEQRPGRKPSGDPPGTKQQRLYKSSLKSIYNECRALLATFPPAPTSIAEAKKSSEWPHWETAAREELTSLMQMHTWTLRKMPPGARTISHKWVFVRKLAPDGTVARYKARLVAHGFKQIPGVDFDETYAPVSRHPTIRALLSHANYHDLEIRQMDVKTAFLNGLLDHETWMEPPEGLGPVQPGHACFLHRALYGLRQSPRVWYETIRADLSSIGFEASPADLGLFYCHGQRETVYLVLYVDDCLIIGPKTGVELTAAWLKEKYDCHDLGNASTYLGMQIERDRSTGTLTIHQAAYTRAIFGKYNLEECRPRNTPLEPGLSLSRVGGQPLPANVPYSSLIGTLLYLSVCTRPDIAFAVGYLTRHLQQPTVEAWEAAKGIVRYLAGTVDLGITYTRSSHPQTIVGFSDSDFAGDENNRRSTSGFCFMLNGGAIAWSSRQQQLVAASTVEAELIALSEATKQALWLQKLTHCLPMRTVPMQIYGDNQGTIALVHNEGSSARTKHISVHHLFTRDRISTGAVAVSYISTKEMTADVLTKGLSSALHYGCIRSMGMYPTSG